MLIENFELFEDDKFETFTKIVEVLNDTWKCDACASNNGDTYSISFPKDMDKNKLNAYLMDVKKESNSFDFIVLDQNKVAVFKPKTLNEANRHVKKSKNASILGQIDHDLGDGREIDLNVRCKTDGDDDALLARFMDHCIKFFDK